MCGPEASNQTRQRLAQECDKLVRNPLRTFLWRAMAYAGQQDLANQPGVDFLHPVIKRLHRGQRRVGGPADEDRRLGDGLAGPGCGQVPVQITAAVMRQRRGKAARRIVPDIFGQRVLSQPGRGMAGIGQGVLSV